MFSKTRKGAASPARPARKGGSFSVIGADVTVEGNLATGSNLQVNGRIEGDVRCGSLHQGQGGTIAGNIFAEEARLAGLVDGTVNAKLLILEPTARVTGDVSYETLRIESGARVDGRFAHRAVLEGKAPHAAAIVTTPVSELFPGESTAQAAE